MRRLILGILIVTLAFLTVTAFSESLDLVSMSDDEIVDLYMRLDEEMAKRFSSNSEKDGYSPWYDYGLGQYLPSPAEVFGREISSEDLRTNSDQMFMENVTEVTKEEFDRYVEACREFGTSDVKETSGIWFEAYDTEGHKITIMYEDSYETMIVNVDPS